MSEWLTLQPATPDAHLPIFVLRYSYHQTGANAGGTMDNNLLLDLRSATPNVTAAMQCIDWEGGGVCTAPDTGNYQYDSLKCSWEQAVDDFHCQMSSPFGGTYTARNSLSDFFLLSGKPAPAKWQNPDSARDLKSLVAGFQQNQPLDFSIHVVDGLGPTTMLAELRDLLPNTRVYVFGSPGAGDTLNAHLSLAIVRNDGRIDTRTIPKWTLGDDAADEGTAPEGFTPVNENDRYGIGLLQQRPGFKAIYVVLNDANNDRSSAHVLYWIGLERANDDVISSAVRVASDAQTYGGCGHYRDDATAVALAVKHGMAEATVTVQPQEQTIMSEENAKDDRPQCAWSGVLHWKAGSGFRVRKVADHCQIPRKQVTIDQNGGVQCKDAPPEEEQ